MRKEVWWRPPSTAAWLLCGVIAIAATGTAAAKEYGDWSAPVSAESLPGSSGEVNTAANDGCPILDPYSNDLYMEWAARHARGGSRARRGPRRESARRRRNAAARRSSGGGWLAPEPRRDRSTRGLRASRATSAVPKRPARKGAPGPCGCGPEAGRPPRPEGGTARGSAPRHDASPRRAGCARRHSRPNPPTRWSIRAPLPSQAN